jgi:hypothetical protein
MATRRISWIDQQINDGVALLLFLPWSGVPFFWRRRIGAMAEGKGLRVEQVWLQQLPDLDLEPFGDLLDVVD